MIGGQPLTSADPAVVGPYALRSRLLQDRTGVAYLGVDAAGQQAAVVVLGPRWAGTQHPGSRLAAAIAAVGARVLAADAWAPVPWVAVAAHDPGLVRWFLDLAGPPPAGQGAVPAGPGSPRPQWGLMAGAGFLIVLLLGLGAFRLVQRSVTGTLRNHASQQALQIPGLTTAAPATPPSRAQPGPPGPVVGPTFGQAEPVQTLHPAGLDFAFRTPPTWSCARSDAASPAVSWFCYESSGEPAIRPGGWLIERPCPAPCDTTAQSSLRDSVPNLPAGAAWHQADASTWYVDYRDDLNGKPRYRLFMTHFWQGHQVVVELVALQDQAAPVQKIANDVRAAT